MADRVFVSLAAASPDQIERRRCALPLGSEGKCRGTGLLTPNALL